jgi:hypothetical protein
MEVVRLSQSTPGEVRLSVGPEVVRITSFTEPEQVRITGVAQVGPRGAKGDHGDYSPDAVVAVTHGSDPDYPRPAGPNVVFWFGTVVPNNSEDFDHVFVPDTVIV